MSRLCQDRYIIPYAIWRIIAISLKKKSGEWYRDRFTELVTKQPDPSRRDDLRKLREAQLKMGRTEREVLELARRATAESVIWDHTQDPPLLPDLLK